jgi:hypothetical protein
LHKTLKAQHPEVNPTKTNKQVRKFKKFPRESTWEHYKEDVRETQQPWWKRTKEEVDSSSSELGHGEWLYDPELE